MKRWMLGLATLGLLAMAIGATAAQDEALGTPNLKSPNAVAEGSGNISVDWRFWKGSNDAAVIGLTYGFTPRLTAGADYVTLDITGKALVSGALRASDIHGYGIWGKYTGREPTEYSWGWAVAPGIEILQMRGTNLTTGQYAGGTRNVVTLEAPIGFPDGDILWMVDPKLAAFSKTDTVYNADGTPGGGQIDGFGTVVGLGLGVVAPVTDTGRWQVFADVTPILAGHNAVGAATNTLERQLPWSVGLRWDLRITDASYLDAFATTASGGTTATSLIASPNHSIGYGVKASVAW